MRFILEIECDNAAFSDSKSVEVARILHELADKIEDDCDEYYIKDINGNSVGCGAFSGIE